MLTRVHKGSSFQSALYFVWLCLMLNCLVHGWVGFPSTNMMKRCATWCRALSTRCDEPEKASRPWDTKRDGFVMGEGAGVLVLESLEHARKRGAPVLAEYLGGAFTCDAYHMTDPRPDGLGVSTCIELALKNSKVDRERVATAGTLLFCECLRPALRCSYLGHPSECWADFSMSVPQSLHCLHMLRCWLSIRYKVKLH